MQPFCIMYVCMQYNHKSMRFLSKIQRNRKRTSSGAHIARLDFGCFLLDGLRVSVSVYLVSSSRAGGGQSCFSGRTSRAPGESTPERLHGSRSAGGRPMLRRYGTTACLPCRTESSVPRSIRECCRSRCCNASRSQPGKRCPACNGWIPTRRRTAVLRQQIRRAAAAFRRGISEVS